MYPTSVPSILSFMSLFFQKHLACCTMYSPLSLQKLLMWCNGSAPVRRWYQILGQNGFPSLFVSWILNRKPISKSKPTWAASRLHDRRSFINASFGKKITKERFLGNNPVWMIISPPPHDCFADTKKRSIWWNTSWKLPQTDILESFSRFHVWLF